MHCRAVDYGGKFYPHSPSPPMARHSPPLPLNQSDFLENLEAKCHPTGSMVLSEWTNSNFLNDRRDVISLEASLMFPYKHLFCKNIG